jgi:hypothetical protein
MLHHFRAELRTVQSPHTIIIMTIITQSARGS